jgi:membrane associated rhomboid family serine protease
MAHKIIEDFKLKARNGDPITRLIIINAAVFLFISIFRILTFASGEAVSMLRLEGFISHNLSLPLSVNGFLIKPWTLLTYMFTHIDVMHVFWNMILLYWFGSILSQYTNKNKLLPLYLLGGICGGIITIMLITVIPSFYPYLGSPMIGASAGVTAIIIAAATLVPTVKINMPFVGPIQLVYVAIVVVFLDVLNTASYNNVGGNLSHLGGALMGYIFIVQYKKGKDMSKGINRFFEWVKGLFKSSPKSKMKVAYSRGVSDEEYNYNKKKEQEYIDSILDKISKSGYESLTKNEKDVLFKASKK